MKIKSDYKKDCFDGILYPSENRKDKVVITLSGSDGGITHAAKMARYFQAHGVPALAVGYFRTRHTPKSLSNIPSEYIDKAVVYLKKQGYDKIAIQGVSKGTEYALLAAANNPQITCIILKAPSWFYGEGLVKGQPSGHSCWQKNGKEIPFTPYKTRKFNIMKEMKKAGEYNLLSINSDKKTVSESVISIEKANGPILIFSTKADNVWPSAESGEKLIERLKANNF